MLFLAYCFFLLRNLGGGGSSSNDHESFSYDYGQNNVDVEYNNKKTNTSAKFNAIFGTLKEEAIPSFEHAIKNLQPQALVHDWYLLSRANNSNGELVTVVYSPQIKYFVKEVAEKEFPEERFKKESSHILFSIFYYNELRFTELLIKQGCSIEEFRALPGMSRKKFEALCDNQYAFKDCMEKGLKITDFANVDEDRLVYIMAHYQKAKDALEFVTIFELLGLLNKPSSNYSPRFYNPNKPEPKVDTNTSSNSCVLI